MINLEKKIMSKIIDSIKWRVLGIRKKIKIQDDYKRSEGEDIIAEFFEEEGINFEEQMQIKLQNDTKAYRIPDFFLPDYNIYVEFLGKWNDEQFKEEYKHKMAQYHKNNIPCIYFYPDNLGILNFLFKKRIRKELKKHKMRWQLFKFNFDEYKKQNGVTVLILLFLLYSLRKDQLIWLWIILVIMFLYNPIKKEFFS
jgi:hypothetical protein